MRTSEPEPVYRKAYRPPSFWIDRVDLDFDLNENVTIVTARLTVRRSSEAGKDDPLVLMGDALELRSVRIDGADRPADRFAVDDESLTLPDVPDAFELETVVAIKPQENTALSGLYKSSGNYCTQCEAEGFRRITYFLDRPDVMAVYTVRIEADRTRVPVLLSNGNRIEAGEAEGGRHWVRWSDPFKKPCYLFALVAGELTSLEDRYVTASGREVKLEIWVEPQNADKCEHAMRSLQKAMKWDEDTFGLEYDLDLYMIVAVSDFNMGAMENKGLNVFNSKYVLARPETATDDDYEGIEGVIGHEYFHNWTGNRVTCRDWFQLTLKEGLTVFRDQQFTADMTSAPVKRISDVRMLRQAQFAEDAGPMAHPVRPESYIEMNNFYTVTVYEKGAEVVRLYHTLFGQKGFRKGIDLYFERHDGQAVTCDDFRGAMADANGADLAQFERWYSQAGTPTVAVRGEWDAAAKRYRLHLSQKLPTIPNLAPPQPLPIPVAVGLVGKDGRDLPLATRDAVRFENGGRTAILALNADEATFTFDDVRERPVPSILRGFSAPVRLEVERGREELAFLMAHDADPFNRWDAGQELSQGLLLELAEAARKGHELALDSVVVEAFRELVLDPDLDGSSKALAVALPSEKLLGQLVDVVDPDAIHAARVFFVRELGRSLRGTWGELYERLATGAPYEIDRASIDRRRLKNTALRYLASAEDPESLDLVRRQFEGADNMTDAQAALVILSDIDCSEREEALAAFYERWKDDALVIDKWFTVQAVSSLPDTAERVIGLARHADFTLENPNRARALIGAFGAANQVRFHGADGKGYAFVAEHVLAMNALNPQMASRLVSCFNSWKRFDADRRDLMRAQLERIAAAKDLSKDVYEIVSRSLER